MDRLVIGLVGAVALYVIGLRLMAIWQPGAPQLMLLVSAVCILLGSVAVGAMIPPALRKYGL